MLNRPVQPTMKSSTAYRLAGLSILLVSSSCRAAPKANVANTIQAGRALAGIEIGMSEAAVLALLGEPRLSSGQSRHYPERHLTVFIIDGKANTILMVKSCAGQDPFEATLKEANQVRTADNVGFGSSLEDVRREFGEPERQVSVQGALDLAYPKQGIEFQVGDNGVCMITVHPATAS
jgi:hypothetical protein